MKSVEKKNDTFTVFFQFKLKDLPAKRNENNYTFQKVKHNNTKKWLSRIFKGKKEIIMKKNPKQLFLKLVFGDYVTTLYETKI